jgi:hypothetical protein
MNDAALLEKYGVDVRGVETNRRGYRKWGLGMREAIVKLTHRFQPGEVSRDFAIAPTLLHKWVRDIEGVGLREREVYMRARMEPTEASATEESGVVGFPTKKKMGRPPSSAPKNGAISFVAGDVSSAIAILSQLRGQKGKVNIIIGGQ